MAEVTEDVSEGRQRGSYLLAVIPFLFFFTCLLAVVLCIFPLVPPPRDCQRCREALFADRKAPSIYMGSSWRHLSVAQWLLSDAPSVNCEGYCLTGKNSAVDALQRAWAEAGGDWHGFWTAAEKAGQSQDKFAFYARVICSESPRSKELDVAMRALMELNAANMRAKMMPETDTKGSLWR